MRNSARIACTTTGFYTANINERKEKNNEQRKGTGNRDGVA